MRTSAIVLLFLYVAYFAITPAAGQTRNTRIGGKPITVNTLNDVTDFGGSRQIGDLPGPDGRVSFREALTAANNTAGPQTIGFAIPTSEFWLYPGVAALKLQQGAFSITDAGTTVDFSTQTQNIGDTNPNGPEVGIYGLEPNGWGTAAIFMSGSGSVIKGLGFVDQRGYAIQISGNNNRVIGCRIEGPIHAAIKIGGYLGGPTPTGNVVGGTVPGDGNYLIQLVVNGPADGNTIIGNTVIGGLNIEGATRYGVAARNTRVGGPTPAERNVISGAGHFGEEGFPVGSQISVIDADSTIVEGNYIGVTADGMAAYPQQFGPTGVEVRDSRGTTVRGNLIAGLRVVGRNHYQGQIFGRAVFVGATNEHNYDAVIENNSIGFAADGTTPIPTRMGIEVSPLLLSRHAFRTLIVSNHIAWVETLGIKIAPQENGITISANSIHDSGGLGIDLFANAGGGVTLNDPGDNDVGANGLQNFAVLTSATTSGASVSFEASLNSWPNEQYRIEFFASPGCDASGYGEGTRYLGSTLVTTDAAGNASVSATLTADVPIGWVATTSATRLSTGDTSEFSECAAFVAAASRP